MDEEKAIYVELKGHQRGNDEQSGWGHFYDESVSSKLNRLRGPVAKHVTRRIASRPLAGGSYVAIKGV